MKIWPTGARHEAYKVYNNILTTAKVMVQSRHAGYVANNIYYNTSADEALDDGAGWKSTTLPYAPVPGDIQDVVDAGVSPGALSPDTGGMALNAGAAPEGIAPPADDYTGKARDENPDIGALEF